MNSGILGIDHLMVAVDDCTKAGEVFSRMGFTVTAKSILPGLSNCLICFSSDLDAVCNYIELMSLDDPKTAPPPMPKILEGPERPVSMVMATADAHATHSHLADLGLETTKVIDLERNWELPNGEVIVPAFSVIIPTAGQAPFYWNMCLHKTPQHYSRPEFTNHENGGIELKAIIAIAEDPAKLAEHYVQHWDATIDGQETLIVRTGMVVLRVHSHKSFEKSYPGIKLQQEGDHIVGFAVNMATTDGLSAQLTQAGFSPHDFDEKIVVDQAQACGCMIVFE